METLDDLIDDDELIIEAPPGAGVQPGEAWTQPAEAPLPPAGPVYRVTLPLLPHEAAARTGGRAPEAAAGFQAVSRRGAGTGSAHGHEAAASGASAKQEVGVEKFSQLRIKSRVMSSVIVEERLRDSRVLRLSHVRADTPGTWAVVAVLAERSGTKEGTNGRRYAVWTLSDLDDTSIKLFLFGDAFAEHSKEHEGSLVCLLVPKVGASSNAPDGGGPGFSLSIDKSGQLFKLGTAADFGLCKGERKDGKPCTMPVNRHVCDYCKYHAAAALKALDSRPPGRMDASGSARAMTERRRLVQAAGRGMGAGAHFAAPLGISGGRGAPRPKPLASADELKRVAQSNLGRAFHSQGSRFVAQVAAKAGAPGVHTLPPAGPPVVRAQPGSVQARMRTTGTSSLPPAHMRNASGLHPQPGSQRQAPKSMVLDDDAWADDGEAMQAAKEQQAASSAREHASQVSRDRGGFKLPDPGGPRQRAPSLAALHVGGGGCGSVRAPAHAAAPRPMAPAAPAPLRRQPAQAAGGKRSFSEVFGAVTAGMEDGASLHAELAEEDVEADLMRTLDYLSKREGLTEAAEKVTSITVQAWKCACGCLTERQRPECSSQGHGGRVLSVKKRFWACRSCKWRAVTLDSTYPLRGCTHCGGSDFDKTPLGGPPKKVDVHDGIACREALLPRGQEHAFSLKSLR